MYNLDITTIVKSHVVPNGKLNETKIMFIDFVTEDEKSESNPYSIRNPITRNIEYPMTFGPKVFTKNLSDETIKNSSLSQTDDIFEEILNLYYIMYLDGTKKSNFNKFEYNDTEGIRKLISLCVATSSIVAQESRRGPANVIILPDNKYEQDLKRVLGTSKIIINPTDVHKDKIFVIRVDSDSSAPGLSLFLSRRLPSLRYMKLVKIMNEMGKGMDDLSFNYVLTKVGVQPEKFLQVIHLT